jgi:hypothetical protein
MNCMHAHTLHTQVSSSYVWAEEDLALLEGSPVISATVSMKRKLAAEYATRVVATAHAVNACVSNLAAAQRACCTHCSQSVCLHAHIYSIAYTIALY